MNSSDSHTFRLPQDLEEIDDDIEIIEVVGLDEDDAQAADSFPEEGGDPAEDERSRDVLLDFDDADDGDSAGPAEIDDHERLLRLTADFENFKNRVEREREADRRHANARLVTTLLPVLDNFERALGLTDGAEADAEFRAGVALIFRQLLEELRKEGLVAVDSVGEPFDPNVHEAVATTTGTGFEANTVVEELQRGYLLHDRLLRPSLVKVSVDEETTEPGHGLEFAGDGER